MAVCKKEGIFKAKNVARARSWVKDTRAKMALQRRRARAQESAETRMTNFTKFLVLPDKVKVTVEPKQIEFKRTKSGTVMARAKVMLEDGTERKVVKFVSEKSAEKFAEKHDISPPPALTKAQKDMRSAASAKAAETRKANRLIAEGKALKA